MNPDAHDPVAQNRDTKVYLTLPAAYCDFLGGIDWSSEEDALVYPNGVFFAFCALIAEFLQGFSSGGTVIPFACVLHWIHFLQNGRHHPDADVRGLYDAFRATGSAWRNAGALAAVLSVGVPTPAAPPRLEHVCHRLRDRMGVPIRGFITRYRGSAPALAEVPAIAPKDFERVVVDRLAEYSDDDLRCWLQTGRGPVHDAGRTLAREQPPPRSLTGVLAALLLRPRLAGAETYVTRLVGALSLPPRRLAPQELPVGGYADMTTRGAVEHILPSQHALDELEFLRRFAERELLFFRREEPPAQNRQDIVVLIDQGVRTWGDVRLVLAAAALALGKQSAGRTQQFRLAGTSNGGKLLDPLTADAEALGELVEASDLSFNPGAALEAVLERPPEALRDVVLLTHPRNLREDDVLAAARRAGPRDRLFAVTLDEAGAAAVSEIRHGSPVTLRQFRVEFVASQPPPPSAQPDEPLAPFAPWTGDVEPVPFPFRFGTSGALDFEFDHDGRWLLTVSDSAMLHLWELDGDHHAVLPRPFLEGTLVSDVQCVIGVRAGFVVAGIQQSRAFAAHYDVARRRCRAWCLGPGSSVLRAQYAPDYHMLRLLIVDPTPQTQVYVLDLALGECLSADQVVYKPRVQQAFEAIDRAPATRYETINSGASEPPLRLSPSPPAHCEYRVDPASGTIAFRQPGIGYQAFIPRADGKPLLGDATISAAQAAGDVLAIKARIQDGSMRLLLFRGPEGTTLREHRCDSAMHERNRFLLSPDGRWLALERGSRVVVEKIETPAVHMTTLAGGYNAEGKLFLGDQCFVLGSPQRHWHLVRWSGNAVEFVWERRHGRETFKHAAFHDVMAKAPLVVVNAASASAPPSYDPQRFVAIGSRDGLRFALDRYGQIAVFDQTGALLCMFMAFRDRLAAWLPDGSYCGSAVLGLVAETPGGAGEAGAGTTRRRQGADCHTTMNGRAGSVSDRSASQANTPVA